VDELAAASPDDHALVWCDDHGNERTFTFADVRDMSMRAARAFTELGIGRGDPVMLILKGRFEFWFALLGLHRIGAVAIPATHMLKSADILYRIRRAGIRMILGVDDVEVRHQVDLAAAECRGILRCRATLGRCEIPGWSDFGSLLASAPAEYERPSGESAVENSDPMLIYFTSGTTGFPKMVLHDFTYPLGHIVTAVYWQQVRRGGLHYTVADSGWAKAVWGKIYGQWLGGSAVFVHDQERFSAVQVLRDIGKYAITTFCAPPTVYRILIRENLAAHDLSSLEHCVVAGEPLNPEVYERFLEMTGLRLMEGYGQTELTLTVGTFPWMTPRAGSMGRPSAGYTVELVDPEGRVLGPGQEGEITLNTDAGCPVGMFSGYYRDQDLSRTVWHNGRYHTGDLARMDEDGYLWFIGRSDDVIKSSGYRIGPFEVESALMEHAAVLECAVTGAPDPVRGQVVKASVVLAKGYEASAHLQTELQAHVKAVTAPYKYPRIIEFVGELPKTVSGKIRRVEIRQADGG
jgi:acetyl-CoA synthetase